MANDPNSQLPQSWHECPTCGHNVLPEELECGLCGTSLHGEALLSLLEDDFTPIVIVPPQQKASTPAAISPPSSPLPPWPPISQGDSLKAAQAAPRLSPLLPPTPLPAQTNSLPPILQSMSKSTASRLASLHGRVTFSWIALTGGVLALIILSFLTGYFISESRVMPPPPPHHVEQVTTAEQLMPTPHHSVGQVTTAEQLMPIYIFGANFNDDLRGVAAFRTHVEAGLQKIRDVYVAQLVTNPSSFGAMVLELDTTPVGQVSRAAVHTTGNLSQELQQVVTNLIKDWRFPPSQGEEVRVFYPLFLSPEKVEAATLISQLVEVWPGWYKVLASTSVPIRAQAGTDALKLSEIASGSRIFIISSREGWLEVLSPKGKVGYVPREAIFPRVEKPISADVKE